MKYGFTGSRSFNQSYLAKFANDLAGLNDATEFTTGGCFGADALIGEFLVQNYPNALHRVIVPANRSQVNFWWKNYPFVVVEDMPHETDYRDRNVKIVDNSDKLLAFCEYPETDPRSKRSGTWMTVRIARKRNIPVVSFYIKNAVLHLE